MTHYSNITTREILNDPMPEMSLLEIISMLFSIYSICMYRDFKKHIPRVRKLLFLNPTQKGFSPTNPSDYNTLCGVIFDT